MPKEFNGNNLLARLTIKADKTVLRGFTDLANRLSFEFPKITVLKQYSRSTAVINNVNRSNSFFITNGLGKLKKKKYELPRKENYKINNKFLFLNSLHDNKKK